MKEKCANCGQLTDPLFLREIKIGAWPFKRKIKICTLCLAAKQEGLI